MSDFTYKPSYTSAVSDKFAELVAKFGEGYEQRTPDGINPVVEVWQLVFDGIPLTDAAAIRSFFRSHVGQSFTWTNPDGVEKRYIRDGDVGYTPTGPNSRTVTVTLKEWFGQ